MSRYDEEFLFTGDIEEEFREIIKVEKRLKAHFWLWIQIIKSVPAYLKFLNIMRFSMFRNYTKMAFRNIKKHKGYSFITITGLAIGMACAIFILLWVKDELSFDGFHANKENIFRVVTAFHDAGGINYGEQTPAPAAQALKNNFPEIVKSTTISNNRITGNSRNIIKYREKAFYTDNLILAGPSFFEIFSFSFLKGNESTALSNPDNVILTSSMAERCFGSEDPINKTLGVDGYLKTVTGIIKDIPVNSHLQFDVILPLSHLRNTDRAFFLNKWDMYAFATYVQLQEGVEKSEIDTKINDLIIKNDTEEESAAHIFLQPLSKIHLYNVDGSPGSIQYVFIFSTIAVIILLIACINYMNLSTARAAKRAKEIGLRKVVGSNRAQLIRQFFSESLFYSLLSLVISVLIIMFLLRQFNELTGKRIDLNYLNLWWLSGLILIVLFTGILSGFYPALYLSSFKPVNILKKRMGAGAQNSLFRKVLVVLQFSLSVGLIICMLIVSNQVGFMKNAAIGFDKENVICLPAGKGIEDDMESFKQELLENPSILNVTVKSSSPTRPGPFTGSIRWEGKNQYLEVGWAYPMVDHDYFKTLNMKIVKGRDFSRTIQSDIREGFILNEEAVRQSTIENPVGKQFTLNGADGTIIGVVKNTQLHSLRYTFVPEIYHLSSTFREKFQTIFIKIGSEGNNSRFNNTTAALASIGSVWKEFMPDAPFEYRFLDETLENQYGEEIRISRILNYFTFLAVFLSCLGLFGLTSFMAEQRTKEIAVRKTLGAPLPGIVFILVNRFLLLILIANSIAWPAAYFVMNDWLRDFANRVDIKILTFAFACILTLVIAVATVIYQSLKAALANPVDSLRSE